MTRNCFEFDRSFKGTRRLNRICTKTNGNKQPDSIFSMKQEKKSQYINKQKTHTHYLALFRRNCVALASTAVGVGVSVCVCLYARC